MGAPQLHRVTPPKYVHIEVAKTEFSQHGLSFALLPYVFSRMPTLPDLSKREYNLFYRVECSQKKTGEKWMADQEQARHTQTRRRNMEPMAKRASFYGT